MAKRTKTPWEQSANRLLLAEARRHAIGKAFAEAQWRPIFVELWLDHPAIGCGFRRFLILKRGSKWAKIFDPFTLSAATIPIGELAAATAVPLKPGPLARRIRRPAKEYAPKDGGRHAPSPAVRQALALLKARAAKACDPRKKT